MPFPFDFFGSPQKKADIQLLMSKDVPELHARFLINKNIPIDKILNLLALKVTAGEIYTRIKNSESIEQIIHSTTEKIKPSQRKTQLGQFESQTNDTLSKLYGIAEEQAAILQQHNISVDDMKKLQEQEGLTPDKMVALLRDISEEDNEWITAQSLSKIEILSLLKEAIPLAKLKFLVDEKVPLDYSLFLLQQQRLSVGAVNWANKKGIALDMLKEFHTYNVSTEDLMVLDGLNIDRENLLNLCKQGKNKELLYLVKLTEENTEEEKLKMVWSWIQQGFNLESLEWFYGNPDYISLMDKFKPYIQSDAQFLPALQDLLKNQQVNVLQVVALLGKGMTIAEIKVLRQKNIKIETVLAQLNRDQHDSLSLVELKQVLTNTEVLPAYINQLKELIITEIDFLKTIKGYVDTIHPYLQSKLNHDEQALDAVKALHKCFSNLIENSFLQRLAELMSINLDRLFGLHKDSLDVLLQGITKGQAAAMIKELASYLKGDGFHQSKVVPAVEMSLNQAYFNNVFITSGVGLMKTLDASEQQSIVSTLPSNLRFYNATSLEFYMKNLLITPVQRIMKYPLLASDMLKKCSSGSEEHVNLGVIKEKIASHCDYVNRMMKNEGDISRFISFEECSKLAVNKPSSRSLFDRVKRKAMVVKPVVVTGDIAVQNIFSPPPCSSNRCSIEAEENKPKEDIPSIGLFIN